MSKLVIQFFGFSFGLLKGKDVYWKCNVIALVPQPSVLFLF